MPNQYQLQQFDPLGRNSDILATFSNLEVAKKNNTVGSARIVTPSQPLIGVGYEVLENITYSIDWTEYKNAVFVGGSGNGEDRLIVQVVDQQAINKSLWGRVEVFEASRDSADVEALSEVGRAIIGARREQVKFLGSLRDLPNFVFGQNYSFGDVLSFSQPSFEAVFNTPYLIQQLTDTNQSLLFNTIYFLKQIDIDNNSLTTTLILNDAISLLDQRIVGYALETPQTVKEMPADDLIKEICRENLLADGRKVANFSVDRNLSLAPTIKVDDIAWRSVLSVCQEVCETSFKKGTPLYFDVVADSNLNLRLKTFVGQRGQDIAGVVGIDSPYRAMINGVTLNVSGGKETWASEFLQLNGKNLGSSALNQITITNNEATVTARSGRSGGSDPFEFNLIDDDGNLIIDDDGEFIVDDDAP